MATEVEIKAKERKEILDEIKRKRAAAAQSEGILGAAERGEYGDVGQGGEKGPFDDEINQDLNKFSVSDIPELVPLLDTVSPTDLSSKGINALMRRRFPALIAADLISSNIPAPIKKNIATKANEIYSGIFNKAREALGFEPQYVMNVDGTLGYTGAKPFQLLKMSDEGGSNVIKSSDEVIVPRQIKVISGAEPDLTKLIIKKDGKDFVNIGSATNNRLLELDKVKLVKDELIEKGGSPRDLYRFALKTSDDDLRFAKKDDVPGTFVMVSGRKIPVEFTTKQKDISGKSYRTINPEAQKIGKGGVPSGEPTVAQKFRNYYAKNFTDKKSLADVANKDTKFRFFDNKRRTMDDVTPEEFFSNNSLKDLEKGGKFHNEYLKFKAIDDVRIKYADELKPILQKMFTKVREGTVLQKKSKANLQLAHKFETSGIKKGYVSPTKTGKGTDPSELYLDVSEYNAVVQKSLEKDARKFYKIYIESGDEAARKEFLKIDKDMRILGIEGQVAPGQTVGKAMPFDDKIRQLADEAINNKFITQKEYDKLINAAEEIAEAKIKFFDTFGVKASYKYGGMVGISHLTRPLGNF